MLAFLKKAFLTKFPPKNPELILVVETMSKAAKKLIKTDEYKFLIKCLNSIIHLHHKDHNVKNKIKPIATAHFSF